MKIFLFPFSLIYGFVTGVRNLLYNIGIFKSRRFEIPVLCVGNITVGGTGKTPHTEFIISELRKKFRVACLSRGYRRKTTGFILAGPGSTARDIGDEPMQIWQKFPDIIMACDADRVRGIEKLAALPQPPEVIVLDDGFQHRSVRADKNIVLIDYNRPVSEDSLLPMGRLRERASALKRADYIILTKCPDTLQPIERRIFNKQLEIKPYQQLFFTSIGYGGIRSLSGSGETTAPGKDAHILCVTGIARPEPYMEHLQGICSHVEGMRFPDHHDFTPKEIASIVGRFKEMEGEEKYIFTTEKDAMRLSACEIPDEVRDLVRYIPVIPEFLQEKEVFINEIMEYVRKNKK